MGAAKISPQRRRERRGKRRKKMLDTGYPTSSISLCDSLYPLNLRGYFRFVFYNVSFFRRSGYIKQEFYPVGTHDNSPAIMKIHKIFG